MTRKVSDGCERKGEGQRLQKSVLLAYLLKFFFSTNKKKSTDGLSVSFKHNMSASLCHEGFFDFIKL